MYRNYLILILVLQVDATDYLKDELLNELKRKRGYTFEDEIICSKECLQNYEEKVQIFSMVKNTVSNFKHYKPTKDD